MVEAATADRPLKTADWASLPDDKLLEIRMCDLDLSIEGTDLETRIATIDNELQARGVKFRPRYWLSDEWFTPDGVPGVAVPFYLAHPRLAKLELAQMLEVEGGDEVGCLRILRHEVGHALDNAYALRRRPTRRRLFGNPETEYPEYYTPKPYSKSFVQHLDHWPISIFWNRSGHSATIEIDGSSLRLEEGEWSKWIDVDFSPNLFSHQHGLIEFCLIHSTSSVALYASPIHWKPNGPPAPLSSPPGFATDVFERVGPFRTLGWPEATAALEAGVMDERLFLDDAQRAFDDRAQIIMQRLERKNWELLVGEIDTLDRVQHVMWRLTDPAHPAYDRAAAAKFGDTIDEMYRRADAFIGEVAAHIESDAVLLVVSAYGGHGATRTFDLNRWLGFEGLIGRATATSSGGITLSAAGRDISEHLVARLTAELDPATRAPIVAAVYRREDIYTGPQVSAAPDLQVGLSPGYRLGELPSLVGPNRRKWSADHAALDYKSVSGVLISSRPTTSDTPRVIDIAPTVLHYFGVPISKEIDGKPLF